jgi:hypothetical protein
MNVIMRSLGLLAVLVGLGACASDPTPDPFAPRTFSFGPITIEPNSEDLSKCVALTLENDEPLYIQQVELTTGPGFHHSNWLWVPQHVFAGPDGIFNCDDRNYDQTAAGILGGVFFAQSTQLAREVQKFPDGVVLQLPPRAKLVAQIHLLNNGDETLQLHPTIGFTPIPEAAVKTKLASVTFEYHTLGLPPRRQSRFSVECDITSRHQEVFGRAPDFKLYYALAHYHEYATALSIEAVREDGTAATIYTTANNVGDVLGGMLDPAFDMTGFSKLRLTCDYYNSTDQTIYYGNGDGEMCIFNAFSDSPYVWAGGALDSGHPGTPTEVDGVMSFTRACQVFAVGSKN